MSNNVISLFCETRVPIKLDRDRVLIFNFNTMSLYEQASGKFYWDTIQQFNMADQIAQAPAAAAAIAKWKKEHEGQEMPPNIPYTYDYNQVLRRISMRELRYMAWAALHAYADDGTPMATVTPDYLGRLLNVTMAAALVRGIIAGQRANIPSPAELGEASAAGAVAPATDGAPQATTGAAKENGGLPSIGLDADAFGLTKPN